MKQTKTTLLVTVEVTVLSDEAGKSKAINALLREGPHISITEAGPNYRFYLRTKSMPLCIEEVFEGPRRVVEGQVIPKQIATEKFLEDGEASNAK